jgi:hypothetical protein
LNASGVEQGQCKIRHYSSFLIFLGAVNPRTKA